ncbi:hypothetical protein D3C84_1202190 [compost metagenome]
MVDLLGHGALLFGSAGDLQVHVADHRHRLTNLPQRRHRLTDLFDTALSLTMAAVHRADHVLSATLQLLDH